MGEMSSVNNGISQKAKQLDFPTERLDENFARDNYEETDYVALASAYLSEYEQEVLSYE